MNKEGELQIITSRVRGADAKEVCPLHRFVDQGDGCADVTVMQENRQ